MALFQYASDVTPDEIADALGVAVPVSLRDSRRHRPKLLSFLHEDEDTATPPPPPAVADPIS